MKITRTDPIYVQPQQQRKADAARDGDVAARGEDIDLADRILVQPGLAGQRADDVAGAQLVGAAGIDAQRICGYMQAALSVLLGALEHTPHVGFDRLSILPVHEREQLLAGFNATEADYPRGLTIAQRFESQVAKRPQAIAAVFAGQPLTYLQLNRQANALALPPRQERTRLPHGRVIALGKTQNHLVQARRLRSPGQVCAARLGGAALFVRAIVHHRFVALRCNVRHVLRLQLG